MYFLLVLRASNLRWRFGQGFLWGLSLWLVDGQLLSRISHGFPSVHVCCLAVSPFLLGHQSCWIRHVYVLSHFSLVRLFVTLWTIGHQAPLSMGFSRQEYWSGLAVPSSRGSSWPRDWTHDFYVSCIGIWAPYHYCHLRSPKKLPVVGQMVAHQKISSLLNSKTFEC